MPVFLNLIWREAHELRWVVSSALFIATIAPLWAAAQILPEAWNWIGFNLMIYPFAAGILFGMRLAAGERGQRTADILAATPVSPRILGLSKLLCTTVAACLPIVQLGILGSLVRPYALPSSAGESVAAACFVSAACTFHVLLVVGVFGMGQKTELLAAGRGLLALALWGLVTLGVTRNATWQWPQLLRYVGPPIDWFLAQPTTDAAWVRIAGVIIVEATIAALATIYVLRYHVALSPLPERPPWKWPLHGWLPRRLASPLAALWWKQIRETVPFGLLVMGISLLLGLIQALADYDKPPEVLGRERLVSMLSIFTIASAAGGFVLALLLGVGAFAFDLEPRINTFWRSRPISAHQWFWTKFTAGFVALTITVGGPALAALEVLSRFDERMRPDEGPLWILLFWFSMYSAAVLATCLVRHILYAAVLAVGLLVGFVASMGCLAATVPQLGLFQTPMEQAAVTLIGAAIAIVLAWQAATRDFALRTS